MKHGIEFGRVDYSLHLTGVRAHKPQPSDAYARARFLVAEAERYGGGSGNKRANIQGLKGEIIDQIGRHNEAHEIFDDVLKEFHELKHNASIASTNPLLTPDLISKAISDAQKNASTAFEEVLQTNRDLIPYRFNEDHKLPSGVKHPPRRKGQEQQ